MSTGETKFERVDGKADFENKPLKILKAKDMAEGETVVGTLKSIPISEKYGTPSYILANASVSDADGNITASDCDVLINGNGSLNKQMAGVAIGELLQVEYRGSAAIKDGKFKGTMSHLFTVRRAVNSEESAS